MLAFPLLGFQVRVHATFLILLVFVIDAGLSAASILLWLLAAFLSVLLHELGHALTARSFGAAVQSITLHGFGGVTLWVPRPGMSGAQRFAVSAAGAGLGFLVAGLAFGAVRLGWFGAWAELIIPTPWGPYLGTADAGGLHLVFFLGAFLWVSVVWGAINWLPIGGLDGSHMLREVLRPVLGEGTDLHTAIIGVVFAIGASIVFFNWGYRFAPILFLLFAGSDLARALNRPR